MKQAVISDKAQADLGELWLYIAQDSPAAADRFLDRIYGACRNLAERPGMGRRRNELGKGLRSFAIGSYLVFYRRSRAGVEIARVLSGYRDLEAIFGR
jgi:plasmid stabilization system protein ParE